MMATLLIRVAGLVLLYLMTIALTRALGTRDFGHLAAGLSLAAILATIASAGLPTLVIRDIARSGDAARNVTIIVKSFALVTAVSIALAAAIGPFALIGPDSVFPALWVGMAVFPLLAFIHLRQGLAIPLFGSANALFPEQVAMPLLALAGIMIVSSLMPFGILEAAVVYSAALVLAFAGGSIPIFNYIRSFGLRMPNGETHLIGTMELLRTSAPFFMAQLPRTLSSNLDVVLIAFVLGPAQGGVYAVASRLASLVSLPLFIVNMKYMPQFAETYRPNDIGRAREIARTATFLAALGAGAVCVVLAASYTVLVPLFGTGFSSLPPVLLALCLGQLLNSGFGPNGAILLMVGHERTAALAMWIQSALLCALTLLSALSGNLVIAACGVSLSIILGNALTSGMLWRKTGILPHPFLPLDRLRRELRVLTSRAS